MVARQKSHNYIQPCIGCIAGKVVESVAGLSGASRIVKLCGLNVVFSDQYSMDITETEQLKNDCFSQ